MNRRVIAIVGALVLVLLGTLLLVAYVNGADDRALEGQETVRVLVASSAVAEGTAAADMGSSVETERVPRRLRLDDAVTNLDQVAGLVAAVDLVPGEQLLTSRFTKPSDERSGSGSGSTPLQKVSVALDPERAIGGTVSAGDVVAVYVSTDDPAATGLVLHEVPVVAVQRPPSSDDVGATADQKIMVTVALTDQQATTFVWAIEHGTIWLSLEPKGGGSGDAQPVTAESVFP